MSIKVKVLTSYHDDDKKTRKKSREIFGETSITCDTSRFISNTKKRLTSVEDGNNIEECPLNISDTNVLIDSLKQLDILLPENPEEVFWCTLVSISENHRLISKKFKINSRYYEYPLDKNKNYIIIWSKTLTTWVVAINTQ